MLFLYFVQVEMEEETEEVEEMKEEMEEVPTRETETNSPTAKLDVIESKLELYDTLLCTL